MSRTIPIALGAGLALAGVLVLARVVGDSAPAERVAAAPADAARAGGGGRRELVPVDLPPTALEPALTDLAPIRETGREREGRAAVAGSDVETVLALVELGSGEVVAEADVWFRWSTDEEEKDIPWELDEVAAFREGARHARSDGAGLVRLSVPLDATLHAVAARGELWGRAELEPPEDEDLTPAKAREHRLELAPDWDLVVEVRDAREEPLAGVPVNLTPTRQRWRWSRTEETERPAGTCVFEHAGFRIARAPEVVWSVAPDLLLVDETHEPLGPERPPGPVVFRLPPLGELEVVVHELDGSPMPDGTKVALSLVRAGERRDVSVFSDVQRHRLSRQTVGGTVLFRHVALAQEFEAIVWRAGSSIRTKAYGQGPIVAGERATLTIRIGEDQPVLLLRAVDAAGEPFVQAELELSFLHRLTWATDQWKQSVTTDPEGRFRIDASNRFGAEEPVHLLVRRSLEASELVGQRHIDGVFGPGLHDLGDVVIAPAPVLAAGRVESSSGEPIAGAGIRVAVKFSADDKGYQSGSWPDLRTDGEGAFELRSLTSGEELQLTPFLEGLRGRAVRASVGETGILLVLRETGAIEGSVLLDEDIPAEEIRVGMRREDGESDGTPSRIRRPEVDEDGRFALEEILPGRYRLDVQAGQGEILESFDSVHVPSGDVCRDPRLQAIDLRGRLFAHRLALVPPTQDADVQGNLRFRKTGDEEGWAWKWFDEREVVLVTPHEEVDVELAPSGFRGVRLEGLRGQRVIELLEGLSIRLILRTDGELPRPPIYVKAVLMPADADSFAQVDYGAPCFDETREIVTKAFAAGRMKVQWVLERRSGGSAMASTTEVQPEQFVEVLDTPGEQVFEIEISAEELARIAEEL